MIRFQERNLISKTGTCGNLYLIKSYQSFLSTTSKLYVTFRQLALLPPSLDIFKIESSLENSLKI